jgi:hypothetical protein
MIWLSALLVFGSFAVALLNLSTGAELLPGFQQMIHARIPWLLLGCIWAGGALAIASIALRTRWWKAGIVLLELPVGALTSWYFLAYSYLPPHELAVGVGDAFPGYALVDQDGERHELATGAPREPALYIFYRGDW